MFVATRYATEKWASANIKALSLRQSLFYSWRDREMDIGHFYFISDQYYIDFPDGQLMQNKETVNGIPHDRPCFYSFFDNMTSLFWMIPISSKVQKFKAIYQNKMQKYGRCDTIVFGEVLGHEKAFLLQNMCPVTQKYIVSEYIDSRANIPVRISKGLESELAKKANKVLNLHRQGIRLIFPDISSIEASLSE